MNVCIPITAWNLILAIVLVSVLVSVFVVSVYDTVKNRAMDN